MAFWCLNNQITSRANSETCDIELFIEENPRSISAIFNDYFLDLFIFKANHTKRRKSNLLNSNGYSVLIISVLIV